MMKFKEINKFVLLALVLSLAFASCEGYAESKTEKCAAKLIVHTNDTVIDTVLAATASESISNLIGLLKDQSFADQWEEATRNEK